MGHTLGLHVVPTCHSLVDLICLYSALTNEPLAEPVWHLTLLEVRRGCRYFALLPGGTHPHDNCPNAPNEGYSVFQGSLQGFRSRPRNLHTFLVLTSQIHWYSSNKDAALQLGRAPLWGPPK